MTRAPFVLRIRREVVYSAIIVATLFAGAEVVLRVKDALLNARRGARPYSIRSVTHDGHPFDETDGQIVLANAPYLVYRNQPSQQCPVWSINRDGFRGPEWRHDKPAGTRRVVVLGGSAAFGMKASDDAHAFPPRLEANLRERAEAHGVHVEVWNAGVIGYESTQELVLLTTQLVDWAPDVVVLFDGWNDFHGTAGLRDEAAALVNPKFAVVDLLLGRRAQPFSEALRHLAVFRSLESGIQRFTRRRQTSGPFGEYWDHSGVALPQYARNLRAMARVARSYGATPVLAPQCELFQRASPPPAEVERRRGFEADGYAAYAKAVYPRFVATARAVAESEGVPFCDCTTAFDASTDCVFDDFVHVNDRGNELIAEHLAPVVAQALGL